MRANRALKKDEAAQECAAADFADHRRRVSGDSAHGGNCRRPRAFRCPSCCAKTVRARLYGLAQRSVRCTVSRTSSGGAAEVVPHCFWSASAFPSLPRCLSSDKITPHDDLLAGIADGKTQVIDLTYAINDKLVPWPGDGKFFEAKDNATVEKDGIFTRSFWMLEHYGTHLDAPIHFPPGTTPVDKIPVKQFFGPAVVIDVQSESAKNADYSVDAAHVASVGIAPRENSRQARLCCCARAGLRAGPT